MRCCLASARARARDDLRPLVNDDVALLGELLPAVVRWPSQECLVGLVGLMRFLLHLKKKRRDRLHAVRGQTREYRPIRSAVTSKLARENAAQADRRTSRKNSRVRAPSSV